MTKIAFALSMLAVVLLAAAPALGADANVVGTWEVTASDTPAGELSCVLTVKTVSGALAGTFGCDSLGTWDINDIKVEGKAFSFGFYPNAGLVAVKSTVEGGNLTGAWEMGAQTGAYTGKRK